MTKEEIQKNSEHWYNKYKDAEKRITDLENKIADIKANCDLAIEGRDIKIKELEKENERLKGDLELWESGGCRATNLFKCGVVKELKEQMEKMKCCSNCKHFNKEDDNIEFCEVRCHERSGWELKEIEK